MLRRLSDLIVGTGRDGTAVQWQDALRATAPAGEEATRARRDAARQARATADQAARIAQVQLRAAEFPPPALPAGAVWAQRPGVWHQAAEHPVRVTPPSGTEIVPDLTLFHDCPRAEMILRQSISPRGAPAPFTLSLDTLRFEGSFLSLAIALPEAGATALSAREIVQLDLHATLHGTTRLYGRLNLQQGPNTVQMLAEFPTPETGTTRVEFDLAYGDLRDLPVDRAWIDLIVERPTMMRLTLQDLILSRRLRAEI